MHVGGGGGGWGGGGGFPTSGIGVQNGGFRTYICGPPLSVHGGKYRNVAVWGNGITNDAISLAVRKSRNR